MFPLVCTNLNATVAMNHANSIKDPTEWLGLLLLLEEKHIPIYLKQNPPDQPIGFVWGYMWWRWRESNPRPKRSPREYLRVQFVYNISFVPGRQTGRHIGSFMSSWPPAKLKAAHVQYLIDALALFGTKTGRTAAYN